MKVVALVLVSFCGLSAATHPITKKLIKRQTPDCTDFNTDELTSLPAVCASVDLNELDGLRETCRSCVAPICRAYQGADADECRQQLCDSCSLIGVMADSDCCGGSGGGSCSGFQCLSDGDCISGSFACDGFSDCSDGSDETSCTTSIIGVIVGAVIGGIVLLITLTILCILITCCCVIRGAAAAPGSPHRPPETRVVGPHPEQTTTTVITMTEMQPAHVYPAHGQLQEEPPPLPYDLEHYPPPPGLLDHGQIQYQPYPEQEYPPPNAPYPELQEYPPPHPPYPELQEYPHPNAPYIP